MAFKIRLPASALMLIGAVVFGGVAVFAASKYISQTVQREKDRLNPNVEMMDVVVAKTDLKRGDIVGSDVMAVRPIPKDYVPGTAVDPASFGNVEGARLAVDMRRGEVLIRGTLEGADVSTFSTRVQSGVRAITLTVDEVNSISGLLQPNDHVDLFFTAKQMKGGHVINPAGTEETRLLMQNVIILATGRQVRPSVANGGQTGVGRAFTTVTIEASPIDVERLILAQKAGSLTAVLRGNADAQPLPTTAMNASELFGEPVKHSARHGEPPLMTEVIVGGQGGGRAQRELVQALQTLAAERLPPPTASASVPPPQLPATSNAEALRDFVKATSVPAEAPTMSR